MSALGADDADALLEECIDELDSAIEELERFPETVLAFALRAHLAALLRVLAADGQITQEELRQFLRNLAEELLSADPD